MSTLTAELDTGTRIQVGDISMAFKVQAEQTPGGIAVHEWELGPRMLAAPPHRHEYEDEVFYVLSGELTVMQDEVVTTVGPGNYAVLPRGHFHTFWNEGHEPVRLQVILSPGRLEEYFEQASRLVQPGAPPDMAQLVPLSQEYGLTMQFERLPELMAEYGLQSDVPPPPPPQ